MDFFTRTDPYTYTCLQVGAGVALEETNEISGEVLVRKVEVELGDAVVQTVANS